MPVVQLDPEHRVRQGLDDRPFEHDGILSRLRQLSSSIRPGPDRGQRRHGLSALARLSLDLEFWVLNVLSVNSIFSDIHNSDATT